MMYTPFFLENLNWS